MVDLDELRDYIFQEIRFGFEEKAQILDRVRSDYPDADHDVLSALYDEVRGEWGQEQASWPAETDCDRLDRAFAAMERQGIVARQYFSCCKNCGQGDILEEMDAARRRGCEVTGYAFYSEADADAAVRYGRLNLSFAATDYSDTGTLEIGRKVADALRNEGFDVKWDDDIDVRIHIRTIDWKRRQRS